MNKPHSEILKFEREKAKTVKAQGLDRRLKHIGRKFLLESTRHNYSYHFTWLGRPIIQFPQDIVAMQEIIWTVKPDLIIETGIAHGGSLIFYASMLELLGRGKVLGIDIDIREHNRKEIEGHPMSKRIEMIQGSSVDEGVVAKVRRIAKKYKKVLVCLDSLHTHDHVLQELEFYSPLVCKDSYIVAFDTDIEFMADVLVKNRPWKKGNNPATAVSAFLRRHNNFIPDRTIDDKLLISVAPGGYLKRIK